jgi:hypothetical protein
MMLWPVRSEPMALWAWRRYSYEGHLDDLQKFNTLFTRRRAPGMMMIEAVHDHTYHRDIYIALPDRLIMSVFLGYKIIEEDEIPGNVSPLVCDEQEFQQRFGLVQSPSLGDDGEAMQEDDAAHADETESAEAKPDQA